MRYYVRMDKLKEESAELKKFGKEKIDNKVDHLLKIRNELEWNSPAGKEFNNMYQEMINKLYDLSKIIEKLATFMEYCSTHYEEANDKVIADWKVLLEEIEERKLERKSKQNLNKI